MTELKFNGEYVMRVGQRLTLQTKPKTKKEDKEVNQNAVTIINRLAQGICAKAKEDEDRDRQLAASQPDPPPPLLLEKTQSQREVDDWYAKSETIKKNAGGISGMEAYEPPPVLLAPVEKEEN